MDWKPLGVGTFYSRSHVVREFYPTDNPGGTHERGWEASRLHESLTLGHFPTMEAAMNACVADVRAHAG